MEFLAPLAKYYHFLYLFVVTLMTINYSYMINRYKGYGVLAHSYDYKPLFFFSVFFVLVYGLRPTIGVGAYFTDTGNYADSFELYKNYGVFNIYGAEDAGKDWLFFSVEFIFSQFADVHIWLASMTLLYVGLMYLGCKNIDRRHGALLLLFCIGSFPFYPYAVNGVRNGVACSIVILALSLLCRKKIFIALILSYMAVGCHKSTVLPIAMMFVTYYVSKPKYMIILWLSALCISLGMGEYIETSLSALSFDDRLATVLQNDDADGVILEHRFRWDFLIYSSMPIILGLYTIFKRKLYNKTYLVLLGTYIYANSFWILAIRAMFSNRIAYLSWFIYPIVLAYPLFNFPVFKHYHSRKTTMILLAHLWVTILLWLFGSSN